MKWLFAILYGLLTIWTGLLRGVEAKAYKPNALWFCMVMGITSIVAGFLYRFEKKRAAKVTALIPAITVLGFYLRSFIVEPEGNATYRVAIIIIASIAQLTAILMPYHLKTKDRI